jgi:cardiolipin synthase C
MRSVLTRHPLVRALAFSAFLVAAGCASLPPGSGEPKTPSSALDPSVRSALREAFEPLARANPGASGFRMLSAGIDGLTARVEMIDAAQRSLDLQYYIFRADESGNLIAQALLRAVDRGVRVRILIDDGETVPGDEKLLALTARPGIEIRIFNPFRYRGHIRMIRGAEILFDKGRLDYRMHNKLMVADNAVAIIGGRNIGDQYFQIDPESQFGDDDVVVAGPMVQSLSGVFDEFWNGRLAIPARTVDTRHTSDRALAEYLAALARYRERLDATHPASMAAAHPTPVAATHPAPKDVAPHDSTANVSQGDDPVVAAKAPFADIVSGRTPLIGSRAELVYDSPDKKAVENGAATGALIYQPVADQANQVGTELLVVTPYFIPSADELAILKNDRNRNVHVRVLTNSLESAPDLAAHSGYMHYRVELLREGVELYEVRALLGRTRGSGQGKAISRHGNYALHGKLFVFDRKTVFIGSMNFDERSKHLNTEIGLLIASPELSRQVAARFDALTQLDNAYALSLKDQPAGKHPALIWTTRESGAVVQYPTEPARNSWQRMKVKLLSILPLDKEL